MSQPAFVKKTQTSPGVGKLLFVDPSEVFLRELQNDPKAQVLAPLTACIGSDAQAMIRDPNSSFSGIFVNMTIRSPDGVTILHSALRSHPGVPVFIIYDDTPPFDEEQAKKLRIQKQIKKPFTYGALVKEFVPPSLLFNPKESIEKAMKNTTPVGVEIDADQQDFVPIRSRSFMAGSKSFFDLYVHLPNDKYLKILKVGDEFSADRLAGFLNKGVEYFYVTHDAHDQYIAYTDKVFQALMKNPKFTDETKLNQMVLQGQRALECLKQNEKIDEANYQFASSYVDGLWKFVDKLKILDKSTLANTLLENSITGDNSVQVTILASILAKELGFQAEKSIHIIGVAGLFHNIALTHASEVLQAEDETKMTAEQKKLFHYHPMQGAKILGCVRGVDPVALQAIQQHHRRRDDKGFPNISGIGSSKIPVTAEIIGICSSYVRIASQTKHLSKDEKERRLEINVFSGYSLDVVERFKAMLNLE